MHRRTEGWKYRWKCGLMNGGRERWKDGRKEGLLDESNEYNVEGEGGWMDGGREGWTEG